MKAHRYSFIEDLLTLLSVLFFTNLSINIARADILFIDCNDSPLEVEAAQRAAEERGEQLILLSTVTEERALVIREARAAHAKATRFQKQTCGQGSGSACDEAKKSTAAKNSDLQKTLNSVPKLNGAMLRNALNQLKKEGTQISSLVISGHDGDRQFWGTYADFNETDLEQAFLANKPMGDGIRSMHLLGCYTATTEDFIRGWKKAFPSSMMVAGYGRQAPLGSRPVSGQVLEDLLKKEKALREETDKNELRNIFNGINGGNFGPSLAVCLDRNTVISRGRGVRSIDDDINACLVGSKEEEFQTQIYSCYLNAEPGCEAIPSETNESNPLRQAYDFFQETKHCEEVLRGKGRKRAITTLGVRRLLFDNTVRRNFEKLHRNELALMNKLLDELGFPAHLRLRGLSGMSRKAFLEVLKGIKEQWNMRMPAPRDAQSGVDSRVLGLGYFIDEVQKIEKGECVPLSWVEDDDQLKDSKCGIRAGMQSAMSRAQADSNR